MQLAPFHSFIQRLSLVSGQVCDSSTLAAAADELKSLALAHDWVAIGFRAAQETEELLYPVAHAGAGMPALYLVSDGVAVRSPPHAHGTWVVIVGISGVEANVIYAPGARRAATPVRTERIGPGETLTLGAEAIHATHVLSAVPTYHLHVYGRPLHELAPFGERTFAVSG